MITRVIDGKKIARNICSELKKEIFSLETVAGTKKVKLAIVSAGDSVAGKVYINCKKRACFDLGIDVEEYSFGYEDTSRNLINCIKSLNIRDDVTGIFVQLPLPSMLDSLEILSSINVLKDVDCLNPLSFGKLVFSSFDKDHDFAPCTALAVLEILKNLNVDLCGKHVVLLNRSNVVGKPLAMLLLKFNATVTICHSFIAFFFKTLLKLSPIGLFIFTF